VKRHRLAPTLFDIEIGKARIVVEDRKKAAHGRFRAREKHIDALMREKDRSLESERSRVRQQTRSHRFGIVDLHEAVGSDVQYSRHKRILVARLHFRVFEKNSG
jgi:hypothetical protein